MGTLDRYITFAFLKNFFMAVFGLAVILLVQTLLSELMDRTYTSSQVIYYRLLFFPEMLVQMTPPGVLIATVITLSGLNRTNELTACYSIGIGIGRIVLVIASLVFMVSCILLVMQDRVLPQLYRKRTQYYWINMKNRQDFFLDVRKDKIWYRSNNLIYNLKSYDLRTRTIYGMSVYTFDDDFSLLQVVNASKALFTPEGWKLMDGSITIFKEDGFPHSATFLEKNLMLTETPTDFQEIEKEVEGLRLKELLAYIQRTKVSGVDTKSYEVKFHSKLSLSLIPLVMGALGVPFSIRNRREGGVARDLGMCFGVTFFYWLFYSVGLSLGTNGALPPWLAAWLPSAVFAAIALVLIARRQAT